jgi:hypothetical protein
MKFIELSLNTIVTRKVKKGKFVFVLLSSTPLRRMG